MGRDIFTQAPHRDGLLRDFDTLFSQVGGELALGRPKVENIAVRHTPTLITPCDNRKSKTQLAPRVIFTYSDAMSVGERIKAQRLRAKRSQAWLAERVKVSQNTISGWENGRTEPSREDVRLIAGALSVDISILELGDDAPEAHKVRLMGYIGAGQAIEPLTGGEPFEFVNAPPGAPDGAEAAIVRGGSMAPLLRDGFMLVWWRFTPDPSPHIGELVYVKTAEMGAMVKILEPGVRRGSWTLHSLSPGFEPLRDVRIEGVAPIEIIYRQGHRL